MNCKAIEKITIEYVDGRIEPRKRHDVETHLAACDSCRARVREFRELWGILDDTPSVFPSPAFDAGVRARIVAEGSRWSIWGWMVPSPRLAIGVTALMAFSIWLSSLPRASPQAIPAPVTVASDADFRMIADLPVLEDYDVLANFEALSELPMQTVPAKAE
jgi:anti-sigma factor RsiW